MALERSGPLLRRRGMLAAALAAPLAVTGCSKGFGALGTPPSPSPDVAILTGAIAAEQEMIGRYQAVLGRVPALAATVTPLLSEHQAHLRALSARLVPGRAHPAPSPAASPAPPAVPGSGPAATAYLGAAERAAAGHLLGLLGRLTTDSASLAQLLASIAAAEATHAAALGVRVSSQ